MPRPEGEPQAFADRRAAVFSQPAAPVTAAMAFPHRLDAPELPDFSLLKRLARDQLIYLLEQVSARHVLGLHDISGLTLTGRMGLPCQVPLTLFLAFGIILGASVYSKSKMKHSMR